MTSRSSILRGVLIGAAVAVTAMIGSAAMAAPRTIHVAPGAAAGDGSAKKPFGTLEQARDAARAARAAGASAQVVLAGGTYEIEEPLSLGSADSGTADAPVVWRAAPGAQVRVVGGRMVKGFEKVTDPAVRAKLDPSARDRILTLDLRGQGVTDYGDPKGGFAAGGDTGLELFLDDTPMSLSRYPNEGFVHISEVLGTTPVDVRGTKGTKEGIFRIDAKSVDDARIARWAQEKDARVLGYWFWDWADQRQKIASIDPATRTFTLAEPHHGYGYRKNQYFYLFNLLSEIDREGEWYLDREAGRLYVLPPKGKVPQRAMVTILPTIVQVKDAKNIVFRGITFEGARGNGIEITGSENCAVIGCTVRNLGKWAINVTGGRACAVRGTDVYATGEGGIQVEGGDRATLTPGGHVVDNCHVHHYSRWTRTYQPGIRLSGVGCRATRNLINDAPHQAIGIGGNEHLVEGNEVHNVCEETNDAGALYGWHDWAARGQVIRGNWFHHIYGREAEGANGVYLDDNFSSATIEGNVFNDVARPIHLGGGRDHSVVNNLFVDCPRTLHIDARGLGWRAYGYDELKKTLEKWPYQQPPWSTRYPQLLTLLQNEPMAPVGVTVARNVVVGSDWDDIEGKAKPYVTMKDNLLDAERSVLAKSAPMPRVNPASDAVKKIGFQPIAADRIGLYKSAERATWPVSHPVTKREWAKKGATGLQPHPAAPVTVGQVSAAPAIDGRESAAEYAGGASIRLAETPSREKIATPAASARLAHDGSRLYVAVTVPIADMAKLVRSGAWGSRDGVEIAFRTHGAKPGPIFVLQGYPDGTLAASLDAGAPKPSSDALRAASRFAATVGSGSWTGEWSIDLAAAGIAPAAGRTLGFNIGVRRMETDDWITWTGAGGPNWQLSGAGRIVLK